MGRNHEKTEITCHRGSNRSPAHPAASTHVNLSSAKRQTCCLQPGWHGYREGLETHTTVCVYFLFPSSCDVIYFHVTESSLLALFHQIWLVRKREMQEGVLLFLLTFLLADVGGSPPTRPRNTPTPATTDCDNEREAEMARCVK